VTRPGGLHQAVDAIAALYDREVEEREHGRREESLGYTKSAEGRFKEAMRLRRLRMGMLRQWQLV
jgi:hypothetical protein